MAKPKEKYFNLYLFIEFFTGNVLLTEIIVNLKTNQTLLIILDPIRLQNGPRLIADLSFYATVPFFDSSRRWQFHEKKNTKIPWKPWDIPNLFEFMADDISTNGPRRINSYVKNNPYLKQMDIHDNSIIYLMIQKQNPEY